MSVTTKGNSLSLPTLYKKTSTGKIQEWTITVVDHARGGCVMTDYGQTDGKKQHAEEWIFEGKNLGKANATTPFEQAQLRAQQQWDKKKKSGYVESVEDAESNKIDTNVITGGIDPMLAHTYEKQGHKIKYPCYVQPKLDGHRCIAIIQDGKATLWSRKRKPITSLPHIVAELERRFGNRTETLVLDGELYHHERRLQDLSKLIRPEKPVPGHEIVQYWVYDIVNDQPFNIRALMLLELGLGEKVVTVPTPIAHDKEEMIKIFGVYINGGFEGLMTRNSAGLYKGKRSYDLQKVKVMQDAEFEIVDVVSGKGKMQDCAIFVCDSGNENHDTFNAKMEGPLDELAEIYRNKDRYIGKDLTVRFQTLTADGIPQFPVGERVREDV